MEPRNSCIIILIDCLRKDFLSCYTGDSPVPTTHIDSLAERGCLIDRAISQSSWTKPALASLFTGLYPFNHKVYGSYDKLMNRQTLPHYFKKAGYATLAFSANPYITEDAGFGRGFDFFWLSDSLDGTVLARKVTEKLRGTSPPYLCYIHFMDTHSPYTPDHPFKELAARYDLRGGEKVTINSQALQQLISLYHGAVKKVDGLLGTLLGEIAQQNTNIVLLADHGDEFSDHGGLFHGTGKLYRENIEVPLILTGPDFPPSHKRKSLVNTVDLLPTLLDTASIGYDPSRFDGISINCELRNNLEINHTAFSEVFAHAFHKRSEALIKDGFKLICHRTEGAFGLYREAFKSLCHCLLSLDLHGIAELLKKTLHTLERKFFLTDRGRQAIELYDLLNDHEERHNIADNLPEKVIELSNQINALKEKAKANEVDSVDRIDADDRIRERLKDLGYM